MEVRKPLFTARVLGQEPAQQIFFLASHVVGSVLPRFVTLLKDGRLLVVEYKGEHVVSADDAKEKDRMGRLWEASRSFRCPE